MNSPVALVITAPTIGFGKVLPSPRRAHSMARAIAASALNTWFIFNTRLASGTGAAKELEQLQHELVSLATRRAELEEVELEIMMRVDGIKERIAELGAEESAHAAEIANLEISKENALTIIFADLKAAADDRAKTAASVNPELMALYEKIRTSNNGTGAAALVGNQCKGCHLTLNTIELQRIAGLPEDELVRCEECRCILVRGL